DVRQDEAAEIGHVFAFGELAVDFYVVDNRVLGILVHDALCAFFELLAIFLGPPVAQVAFGIKLAALIVKAVRQLVADCASGIAVVGRVVKFGIVERRLQNSGRKVCVIHLGIVI